MKNKLTHGSCFAGIGGFELGAKNAGIKTVWSIENNEFCQQILKKHFPKTQIYGDIYETNTVEYVDIITGGFPCQDISVNGKGDGITGEKSSAWSQMFRICSLVRPKYIVIENSPALTFRGLDRVLSDLSTIGYDAEWQCIQNNLFGFPHERERIYLVAYPNRIRTQGLVQVNKEFRSIFQLPKQKRQKTSRQDNALFVATWIKQQAENRVFGDNDGLSNYVDRVTAIGNTVNPVVTEWLFNCIKNFENENTRINSK